MTEAPLSLHPYRGPVDDPPARDGGWVAAVAVILRGSELLLIRRSSRDGDPWSGHMALPGGRRDPSDASLLDTATREAMEEVAVPLADDGRVLGRLDIVAPMSPRLPPLTVLPLVFSVPAETKAYRAAPDEVEEVYWVPIAHLRDPASRLNYRYPPAGGDLIFPAFDVAGHAVWGLTHRVLSDLIGRLG